MIGLAILLVVVGISKCCVGLALGKDDVFPPTSVPITQEAYIRVIKALLALDGITSTTCGIYLLTLL